MKLNKKLFFNTAALMSAFLLAGCSPSATSKNIVDNTASESLVDAALKDDQKVRKIIVGTGNNYKPYCYLDENGNLAGYELAVLSAVDELLPQYEFQFETFEFASILLGVENQKIDLGAHQYELNEERQKKFLFSDESYTTYILRITVKKDRTDIASLDDLQGKTVETSTGGNAAYILEEYNKKHSDNKINIVYSQTTPEGLVANIDSGAIDAIISITRVVEEYNEEFGNKLKTVGEPISTSNTYYVFRKQDTQLKEDVDGALKQLRDSGKLADISVEILGRDYTTND